MHPVVVQSPVWGAGTCYPRVEPVCGSMQSPTMSSLHVDGWRQIVRSNFRHCPSPWELQALTLEHIPALASTVSKRFHHNHFNIFWMLHGWIAVQEEYTLEGSQGAWLVLETSIFLGRGRACHLTDSKTRQECCSVVANAKHSPVCIEETEFCFVLFCF